MTKKIFLCTGFLVMNLCACGTSVSTEEVITTEQSTITTKPTKEATATPTKEKTGNSLSIKKGGEAFLYGGKEVPIGTDKSDGAYIMELEYINDTQIAVFCHYTLNAQIFLVYDTEKEEYIAKKKGVNFTWKNNDITTLVYVAGPQMTHEGYVLYDYNDKDLYHSEQSFAVHSFTEDENVKIVEKIKNEDEAESFEKEIPLK